MKRLTRILFLIWIVFLSAGLQFSFSTPVSGSLPDREVLSAAEIISSINAYRASNGLPAYQTNSLLMAAAQAQSDYQASIGDVTHTGPGGTRPSDRAYAIGYGDGNRIWISEIIYGGINATVSNAVGWWKTSTVHNDTMLSPNYLEIGAGVASAGGMVYYTAVTGYITGSPAPEADQAAAEAGAQEQAVLVIPVVAEAPREDGSIVHTIRTGQSLWNIAAVYDVSMEKILELNNLTENSMLQIGQEILVLTASEAAARITPSAVPSAETTEVAATEEEEPASEPEPIVTSTSAVPEPTAIPPAAVPEDIPGEMASAEGPDVGVFLAASVVTLFFALAGVSFTRIDLQK